MDWKNGEDEDMLSAKAEVAPLDKVAEIVERYQTAMLDARSAGGFLSPRGSSGKFEKAVLSRDNSYLNLLLSRVVSDWGVARALWDLSEVSADHTDEYRSSIKKSILSGSAVWSIIKERRQGRIDAEGRISIVDLINQDQWNADIYAILTNPNIKPSLSEILLREGSFAGIHEYRITAILKTIADNTALNEDNTNHEDPDLDHWALQNAITNLINNAPVTKPWFYALDRIITAIEPEAFHLRGFPSKEFVARWLAFKPVGEFGDDESDVDKEESDGFYTKLKAGQEFLSIFAAKFGDRLIVDMDLDVEKALALPNSYERAAFFGTKSLNYKDVVELLDGGDRMHSAIYGRGTDERFWLIFNPSVMRNAESRALILPRLHSYQRWFFESRIKFLEKIYPDDFKFDESAVKEERLSKDIDSISETVINLKGSVSHLGENLINTSRGLNTVFYIVVITLVIQILIAFFK